MHEQPLPPEATVAAARRRNLHRAFQARREALADTVTVAEAAKLLGSGTETIHDRARAQELLAVEDQGHHRMLARQFDSTGPNGTLSDLSEVLCELCRPPARGVGPRPVVHQPQAAATRPLACRSACRRRL
ncbi:hypothetical protein VSS74_05710 [Conexibacter stalactiti]|uniref:Uncharacterized protein n=1 Tax=Conexibacter stalactiti TaxID=1940611 RepID=A0ABU4HM79_9ACTN|nr:hypothetical protein [Conexibacter stalactiti]MDW5593819.1 hypothetical protein [Conexibacter stalactiti]MEC5034461.1 hypothetical protein [Conexibacter stalactiti]